MPQADLPKAKRELEAGQGGGSHVGHVNGIWLRGLGEGGWFGVWGQHRAPCLRVPFPYPELSERPSRRIRFNEGFCLI